ncbi:ABC transporter substrate-binding protein [Vibrio campbellii]|uniref:ABC transporter substrate-binding protein n=1 Tax=Vibrio campbellii TaxID=680 RepID=UPI0009B9539C|nr:ABC transporter substrate-binding protein [Vibrio campbellii]
MKKICLMPLFLSVSVYANTNAPTEPHYPVSVESCGEMLTFEQAPRRAVFQDLNMTEMAFALGLQPNMVAVNGITGWYQVSDQFKADLGDIPEISGRYLTLEPLLEKNPDFLFAGWNYGLKFGSDLTPQNLAHFGVKTLVLSESCAHITKKKQEASMELLYGDVLKLGKVFDKSDKAQSLVENWKKDLNEIEAKVAAYPTKKVFLYDSGIDQPFTSGRFAMPHALIKAAGGVNVMGNENFSWGTAPWEKVAIHNPDMIILVDYGSSDDAAINSSIKALSDNPLMRQTNAVKNGQFLRLKYSELTPGPNNVVAIKKIAAKLHPEAGIVINE